MEQGRAPQRLELAGVETELAPGGHRQAGHAGRLRPGARGLGEALQVVGTVPVERVAGRRGGQRAADLGGHGEGQPAPLGPGTPRAEHADRDHAVDAAAVDTGTSRPPSASATTWFSAITASRSSAGSESPGGSEAPAW